MDDAVYLFKKRTVEAKRLARGAYAKKGGSRSKKCSLPSDHLTPKQLKERNGVILSYKMREPMTWSEFMSMPNDLQKEYMQFLAIEKKARLTDVAEMFGKGRNYLSKVLGGKSWYKDLFSSRRRFVDPAWIDFISKADSEPSEPAPVEPTPEPADDGKIAEVLRSRVKLDTEDATVERGEILYKGLPASVFEKAYQVLDKDCEYWITVTFDKVCDDDPK